MMTHHDARILTPFGAVSIAEYHGQLAIELLNSEPSADVQWLQQSANPLVQKVCLQVIEYLKSANFQFNLPVSQQGTPFQQRVWQAIAAIPYGQTRTYGQLAHQLGSGPRAVANACGANQLPLLVPCHRVVAQNGIGGFMQGKQDGLKIKQWLLRHEGVKGYSGE